MARSTMRRASKTGYWKLQSSKQKFEFFVGKFLFLRRQNYSELKANNSALGSLFKSGIGWIFLTITLALMILVAEKFLKFIPIIPADSLAQYSTITMGISAIGGVFIGLYYSGLTAAAGAVYANAPNQVRDLLVRERTGSAYMHFLAFYTSLSLVFSLIYLVFGITSFTGAALLVALTIIAVFGFVNLGKQAFNFFNPVSLSLAPLQRLNIIPNDVMEGGFLSKNPTFQNHAKNRALEELSVIESIATICSNADNLRDKPLASLCQNLAAIFLRYRHRKTKIPLNSKWFIEDIIHPDWYKENFSSVGIAIRTGTLPQTKNVPDLNWFENRIWKILKSALIVNLKNKEYKQCVVSLRTIKLVIGSLAKTHDLHLASRMAGDVISLCNNHITPNSINSENLPSEEALEYLQLISALGEYPTELLLGFTKSVVNLSENKLKSISRSAELTGILKSDRTLPLEVYRAVTDLNDKLSLEKRIEGRVVSAPWYIAEILRLETMRFYKRQIEKNLTDCINQNSDLEETVKKNGDTWAQGVLLSSKIEFINKVDYHWSIIRSSINDLSLNKKISDLDWPLIKFDEFESKFQIICSNLSKDVASTCCKLLTMEREPHYPDFAGQFMAHTNQSILDALIDCDEELLFELLADHMVSCVNKTHQLSPTEAKPENPHSIGKYRTASAPLLDLIELLGLALLVAELRKDNGLIAKIEKSWNALVTVSKNPNFNQWVILTYNIATQGMIMEPRYAVKFEWRKKVENLLEEGPYLDVDSGRFFGRQRIPNHECDFVNAMMPDSTYGTINDIHGGAIFIHRHLRKFVSPQEVSEGSNETMLIRKIESHQRRVSNEN